MRKIARLINKLADRCERWRYGNSCFCGCGENPAPYPFSSVCEYTNPCGSAPRTYPFSSGCGYVNPCG